jgi:hypothetical protein
MSDDLKLITKRKLGNPELPLQNGSPSEFFGEQSNDIQLSLLNDFEAVTGLDKLKQDINKILLTNRGSNSSFPLYGTDLQSLIGSKTNFQFIKAKVKDEVIGALQVLQYLNKDNPNPDEKPAVFEFLKIQQLNIDQVEIQISVITESNKRVSTGIVVTV